MHIYSVTDPEFRPYGRVLEGYDTAGLLSAMEEIPLPEEGTAYQAGIGSLEACEVFNDLQMRAYGGMPIELGMCWGRNTKLNCLEYHRDSEINIGWKDFILLLARQQDIENGQLDTGTVMAFRAPAGVPVEVYATSLHYAPCHVNQEEGFRVAVALPRGTNLEKPDFAPGCEEDTWMTAKNKWLLAHPDSQEAKDGAHIGLTGVNIDIKEDL